VIRSFNSVGDFVQYMSGQAATLPALEHAVLNTVGRLVKHEAQRVIGTYDYGWSPLAEATQQDRVRKGFPADEPLLRTGELLRSIEHKVVGRTVHIGSDLDIAMFQELGTQRIPARPFLSGALAHKQEYAVSLVGRAVAKHLQGGDGLSVDAGPPIL
jgi:phage gpG-like protein